MLDIQKHMKFSPGNLFLFQSGAPKANLSIYRHTHVIKVGKEFRAGYKHAGVIFNNDTFVVLFIGVTLEPFVISSRGEAGFIYKTHLTHKHFAFRRLRV